MQSLGRRDQPATETLFLPTIGPLAHRLPGSIGPQAEMSAANVRVDAAANIPSAAMPREKARLVRADPAADRPITPVANNRWPLPTK
jgi:hypothetical protein